MDIFYFMLVHVKTFIPASSDGNLKAKISPKCNLGFFYEFFNESNLRIKA